MNAERLINIILMVTIFGLVFSVWCICVFLWLGQYLKRVKAIQKRLGIVVKETDESKTLRLWRGMQQEVSVLKVSRGAALRQRLETLKQDAGWRASARIIILRLIGTAVLGFVITYLLGGGVTLGISIGVLIVVIFCGYTQKRIIKRAALFERQLVDALSVAARALRAGHPLVGAFQLVAEEIGEPLGDIFYRICQEQTLGLDLKDSIHKVATTTHNAELKLFATAVAIQFKSGGNLADLMDSLAEVIRARMRINRRIRVITAQTQFSKRVLVALPILVFFLLNILSPQYMNPFYSTNIGRYMLVIAASSVLLGVWVMNRLAVLRY